MCCIQFKVIPMITRQAREGKLVTYPEYWFACQWVSPPVSPVSTTRMAVQDFSSLPLYSTNTDLTYLQDNIPLPDSKENLPYAYKTYEDVDEPIFDPSIHLDLQMPDQVKTLPDYKQAAKGKDGNLAYSKPFQFLSANGLSVIRNIITRETPSVEPL